MYKIIAVILMFCSTFVYGQFLPGVKHIEVVSEIQDSMVLLNKPDVDKINKMYFEKEKLDSLNMLKLSLMYKRYLLKLYINSFLVY